MKELDIISSTSELVLASDAVIDLQLHTVYSDGVWTPEQLLDHLTSEGFGLASITDHDRVDTVQELQRLAIEKQFALLIAVEMTTPWHGKMIDVLCYGFDPANNAMSDLTQDILRRQQENTREVYENLRQKGNLSPSTENRTDLLSILEKPSAQQPHELVHLLKKSSNQAPGVSIERTLAEAGMAFATNDIVSVVNAAQGAGGVCLLAHPGRRDFTDFDVDLLDQLWNDVALDGLEVYYPAHTPEQTALYHDYACKHNLLVSSGSDSHGPNKNPIKYPASLSHQLLNRVGIQIAK